MSGGIDMVRDLKCFPIMEPSLSFTNVKIITFPTISFINDFGSLTPIKEVFFYGKKDLIMQVFWKTIKSNTGK